VTARLAQSPVSQTLNTSFVERDKLTQRQQNRRLTRRTHGFSKDLTWFEKQGWLSLAYYHLILPRASLRNPLPVSEPTLGTGSPRRWRPVTPAMAAGITDYPWTTLGRPVNSCRIGYRLFTGKSNLSWKSCSLVGPKLITETQGHYPFFVFMIVSSFQYPGLDSTLDAGQSKAPTSGFSRRGTRSAGSPCSVPSVHQRASWSPLARLEVNHHVS